MINILPQPVQCKKTNGKFHITKNTKIIYQHGIPKAKNVAKYFSDFIARQCGIDLEISSTDRRQPADNSILLTTYGDTQKLGQEGYKLSVKPTGVTILAGKPAGLFYGLQSLRQLLPAGIESKDKIFTGKLVAPCVDIVDYPRFTWRGMHYDPCRNFLGVNHILEYIDFLAMQKFNILHLHLTEDQGWRIEINEYPKLMEIAAWRNGTNHLHYNTKGNRKKHGGFYSRDDIRTIVKYAADRFITVVPEIEMPGHAQAAIAAYPELSCTGGPHKVRTQWGISKDVYCAGNEKVFKFLETVLAEVMELFPSQYIHIGGDECPKDRWKKCPKCQARIRKEGLADEHELQSYFIRRIEKFINACGRKIIGWDEILEGGLAPNATVMSWRGYEGGLQAAAQKHNVIMTPCSHTYFDYRPSKNTRSGQPCVLPLEKVYSFNPEEGFPAAARKYILGGQGAMWSEYINTREEFNHHLFPRLFALGEVLWSPHTLKNFKDFSKRTDALMKRLTTIL